MKAVRSFTVRPRLPAAIAGLDRLAANLRWAWHRPTRALFASIDADIWAGTGHDPRLLLARVAPERLNDLAADTSFVEQVQRVVADLEESLTAPSWFDSTPSRFDGVVAYFSPEFGIAEAVPQYSGGLGILAGDHLKAASDLGVPLVGVGLFYRHGYFRQSLSVDGWQQERFPDLDPYAMSMELCDGVRVEVALGDERLHAQVWRAEVGRTPLYLLDADIDDNSDELRLVTDRLYGGDTEHRLRQEILLGVGGVRMLRALGIEATVFHTNEGHAGFLGLERIRQLMAERDLPFDEAWLAARAGCVFTTHTPVPAGIDRFPRELIERYFGAWAMEVGLSPDELMAIGHRPEEEPDEKFNMAVMGMRLAERRNGVAALHGEVSREMFGDLWPGVPVDEVPIGSVTNGVHPATWTSAEMSALYDQTLGTGWATGDVADWHALDTVSPPEAWRAHVAAKERLVGFCRATMRRSGLARGLSPSDVTWTDELLDPSALTICFARRFATYKRATLLLSQPDRLRALLTDPQRPVQFVFAGKAHPADEAGKELIRQIVTFASDPAVRLRFCFLEDYDISVSRHLLQGADVWLNTPLRPQEACGTSGMKATLNAALNCSVLDGWWAECFEPDVGWAISSAEGVEDPARRDELEANSLFDLLEQQVVPLYHRIDPGTTGEEPVPVDWVRTMMHSVAVLGPKVHAARMVRDYVTNLYEPSANHGAALTDEGFAGAAELASWRRRVLEAWHQVHVDVVDADESVGDLATVRTVTARVSLGTLGPGDVEVQLVSGLVGQAGELESRTAVEMIPGEVGDDGHHTYRAELRLDAPGRRGLTVRVVPRHRLLVDPLELGCVAWAR
ncbi:MAG TPA: alpha-glucan family phosphorylase [Microthrixaceae bacterium]|nr:alpha-glucan family phosphorylase [Microthrixaceae bacterium]